MLFSALLLAGGRSTRMGTDKAGVVIDGAPLWQRQLATLRATGPADIFISGGPGGPYAESGCEIIQDQEPDQGPLAGLSAAWRHVSSDLLLVLAIDLPDVKTAFLQQIVKLAVEQGRGVVPMSEERFEPLAAVYSRATAPLIEECLQGADRSLQRFVREAVRRELVTIWPLSGEELPLFRNVNTPADLTGC